MYLAASEVIRSFNEGDFDENDMINDLQIEDDDFHTELPEPMQPEEWQLKIVNMSTTEPRNVRTK